MPELPEVETVKKVLLGWVKNKKITNSYVYHKGIIEDLNLIKGETILDVTRYGKNLMFVLDNYVLTSHLRMEGKYYYAKKEKGIHKDGKINFAYEGKEDITKIRKHTHVVFELDNKDLLLYHDVRKFGKMHLYKKEEFNISLLGVGKEPFDIETDELFTILQKRKNPIKEVLLDQSVMSGIGNIYADEICFKCGFLPTREALSLTKKEVENLIKVARNTLLDAIKDGGSTIKSYHSGNGVDGLFQTRLLVYGKKGEPCVKCGKPITKIKLKGRGTCFCGNCQK